MKNLVAACLVVLSGVVAASGQEPQFSELIAFGDSLSDAGNLGVHEPPYHDGRFSNGPSWIDRLADRFGIERPKASKFGGMNFAWAAATTRDELQFFDQTYIPGLDAQITEYLADGSPQDGQLFSVWVGTNDFWERFEQNPELSANWVATGVDRLLGAGVQDLLVLNLSVYHGEMLPDTVPRYNAAPLPKFNSTLAAQLNGLREKHPSATIYEFDYASFLDTIVSDPALFNLTEPLAPACADCGIGGTAGVDIAPNPEEFYFWDEIHISRKGNQLIADEVYRQFFAQPGDFDLDELVDVMDVELLGRSIREKKHDLRFDLTDDQLVNLDDLTTWVHALKNTWFGDANLDGEFNTSDLIEVFQAGKFETSEAATWNAGDWDADGQFGTGDLIAAFQDGGFEMGQRVQRVAIVPEPSSLLLLLCSSFLGLARIRRMSRAVKKENSAVVAVSTHARFG